MQKTCSKCHIPKETTLFHKDGTSKDGLSAACGQCRNASKRIKGHTRVPKMKVQEVPAFTSRPVSVDPKPKVTITQENPYEALSKKIGSFYTIAVSHDGTCRLQIFGNGVPTMIKGENFNVEELLKIAY